MGCFFWRNLLGIKWLPVHHLSNGQKKSYSEKTQLWKKKTAWKRTHSAVSRGFSIDLKPPEMQIQGSFHASALAFGKALAACSTWRGKRISETSTVNYGKTHFWNGFLKSVYPINLQEFFVTSQVVVWDFWTINSSLAIWWFLKFQKVFPGKSWLFINMIPFQFQFWREFSNWEILGKHEFRRQSFTSQRIEMRCYFPGKGRMGRDWCFYTRCIRNVYKRENLPTWLCRVLCIYPFGTKNMIFSYKRWAPPVISSNLQSL